MKKLLLLGLCLMFSQSVFAVNPKILSYTTTYYPSAGINYYSQAEDFLVEEANKFCTQFKEQVDKISNINIQIQADFILNTDNQEIDKTRSITYPNVVYTALVSCKAGNLWKNIIF